MANKFGWFPDVEGLSLPDHCFDRGLSDDREGKRGHHVLKPMFRNHRKA